MAAANTDKWRKGASLFSTTLSSSIGSTDLTIPLNSVTGLATDTAVTLTIDGVNSSGVATPSLREVVTGTVSGNNLVLTSTTYRGKEGTAQSHASGAVVTEYWTKSHWDDAIDSFLTDHTQPGAHKFTQVLDANGNKSAEFALTASAVNNWKTTNSATGNNPSVQASGEANRGLDILDSNGNQSLKASATANAVNYFQNANAATGNGPTLSAQGTDNNIAINATPKGTGAINLNSKTQNVLDQSGNTISLDSIRNEDINQDFVASGLNPSTASSLSVTIPLGTYYIAGKRYTYAGGSKTVTASKDCYLDIDTSGNITSVEVANGATAGMTLTANAVRFAKVVSGGSSISSYQTSGRDSLGNSIRPTRLTMANPYKFKVFMTTTGVSLTANTPKKVAFNTKEYDYHSDFDVTTNNRFTASVGGVYLFSSLVTGGGSPAGARDTTVMLYKNGSLYEWLSKISLASGTGFGSSASATPVPLLTGDYVEIFAQSSVNDQIDGDASGQKVWFSGALIGQ